MFLFIFLGLLDLLVALVLFLSPLETTLPFRLVLGASLYLLAKGYLFRGDFFSYIDMGVGFYILLTLLMVWPFLSYFFAIYLFIKGAYSIVSTGIFVSNT